MNIVIEEVREAVDGVKSDIADAKELAFFIF